MAGTIRKIKIRNLMNYFENPRHAIASSEEDTLKKLFASVGNQYMLNLAEDIQTNGLLGSQQVVVVPASVSGKYIVYEGNRRIAAIKLLLNPENFSFLDRPTLDKVKRLSEKGNVSSSVNCYITDEAEAFFIMERVHSGEDRGRGTKSWTPREKEAFKVRQNHEKNMSYLIDYYVKTHLEGFDITSILPFTTVQRIFNNREVKKQIGLSIEDEATFTKERMELVVAASRWIANKAEVSGVAVTRLFNKARTIEDELVPWITTYLNTNGSNEQDVDTGDANNDSSAGHEEAATGTSENSHDVKIGTNGQGEDSDISDNNAGTANADAGSGSNRNLPYFFQGLSYGGLDPHDVTTHGVSAVCNELRLFSDRRLVDKYPIASAFLVRAIIEQSIIYYSKHHTIQGQNKLIWENIKGISKLSGIIDNYKRHLPNYITDAPTRQIFTHLFGDYEKVVDPLNWVVHKPAEFRLPSRALEALPGSGLLTLINYLIM